MARTLREHGRSIFVTLCETARPLQKSNLILFLVWARVSNSFDSATITATMTMDKIAKSLISAGGGGWSARAKSKCQEDNLVLDENARQNSSFVLLCEWLASLQKPRSHQWKLFRSIFLPWFWLDPSEMWMHANQRKTQSACVVCTNDAAVNHSTAEEKRDTKHTHSTHKIDIFECTTGYFHHNTGVKTFYHISFSVGHSESCCWHRCQNLLHNIVWLLLLLLLFLLLFCWNGENWNTNDLSSLYGPRNALRYIVHMRIQWIRRDDFRRIRCSQFVRNGVGNLITIVLLMGGGRKWGADTPHVGRSSRLLKFERRVCELSHIVTVRARCKWIPKLFISTRNKCCQNFQFFPPLINQLATFYEKSSHGYGVSVSSVAFMTIASLLRWIYSPSPLQRKAVTPDSVIYWSINWLKTFWNLSSQSREWNMFVRMTSVDAIFFDSKIIGDLLRHTSAVTRDACKSIIIIECVLH